jgi:hypothetical protein
MVDMYRRFGEIYCLLLQGKKRAEPTSQQTAVFHILEGDQSPSSQS